MSRFYSSSEDVADSSSDEVAISILSFPVAFDKFSKNALLRRKENRQPLKFDPNYNEYSTSPILFRPLFWDGNISNVSGTIFHADLHYRFNQFNKVHTG